MEPEVVVVRLKEGPCPEGALCIAVGGTEPRRGVKIPEGDYLVVMSPVVTDAVDLAEVRQRFRCVICVGPSTAEKVGNCVVPREYTSYGVARLLKELAPGRVVVLRSSRGNDVLKRLVPGVVEVPVYDVKVDEARLGEATRLILRARAVVLTSSMVAELIAGAVDLRGRLVVAIGRVTAERLAELGIPHITADEATIKSAVQTALRALGTVSVG